MTYRLKRACGALLCTAIAVITLQSPSHAIPQDVDSVLPEIIINNTCEDNRKPTKISITFENGDEQNLHLAKQMELIMAHSGYSKDVTRSLYRAYLKTGVDFKLLVLKAIMESDYGRFNVASNSSARGVFQYIESTWMVLMHRYGDKIGYGHYAKAIHYNPKTKTATLKGAAKHLRHEILALRHNPEASALIKSYQILEETDVIQGYKRGKKVTATDHYIAHMLGLYVMKDFYKLIKGKSSIAPARLSTNPHMREAARTNKAFFFKGQRALSAQESYLRFDVRVKAQFKKIDEMSKTNAQIIPVSFKPTTCLTHTKAPEAMTLPALLINLR